MVLQPSPCLSAVKGCWVCYLCPTLPAVSHLLPQSPPFCMCWCWVWGLLSGCSTPELLSRNPSCKSCLKLLVLGLKHWTVNLQEPEYASLHLQPQSPSTEDGSKTRTSLPRVGERLSTPTPWTPSDLASPCSTLARLDATLTGLCSKTPPST